MSQEENSESNKTAQAHAERAVAIAGSVINSEIRTGDTTIVTQSAAVQLAELEIGKEELEFVKALFVPPVGYETTIALLSVEKPIWIVGPPDAGKGWAAIHLASSQLGGERHGIYRVRNKQDWGVISHSEVSESVIILTNASYLVEELETNDAMDAEIDDEALDDEEPASETDLTLESENLDDPGTDENSDEAREGDIHPLHRMTGRGNTVIITCAGDLYGQAGNYAKLSACFDNPPLILGHESYDTERKLKLVGRSITMAYMHGYIQADTVVWANEACLKLKEDSANFSGYPVFQESLPGKLHNFVISILVSAKNQSEIEDGFKISLNDRVYSWLMRLEGPARFFVLARALFPELEEDELLKKMGEIVERLRRKYALTPEPSLSVYAFNAAPFIIKRPPYRFINTHVSSAAAEVIAEYFNDSFREMLPLFKQWSVPSELDTVDPPEQDRLIKETAYVRESVARMAGKVGGQNLGYVKDLLDYWASQPFARIGQAAGITLRHAVISGGEHREAFRLVEEWSGDFGSSGIHRRRTAADASGLMATAEFHPARCERAMGLLESLAKDNNRYVREAASRALTRLAGMYSETVKSSLRMWATSDNPRLIWTTVFYQLTNWGSAKGEKALLCQLIEDQRQVFKEVSSVVINRALRRKSQKQTLSLLKRIINELAERNDAASNQQAALTLFRLSEKAIAFHRPDVRSYARKILARWSVSQRDGIRFTAFAYSFASCQNRDEKLNLANGFFKHSVFDAQTTIRMQSASRLAVLRGQDAGVVEELLQGWLASGNKKACATVVFYWLVAKDYSEEQRSDWLIKLLSNFPIEFEEAMMEAIQALPAAQLLPVVGRLALCERVIARKQAALALCRISDAGAAQLLQDLLLSRAPRAYATVIFYWLAVIDRPESHHAIVEVLRNFPIESAQAIREAVQVFDPDLLTSVLTELAGRDEFPIRLQASSALDGLIAANPGAAGELLSAWANADNINLQKALVYVLIISTRLSQEEVNSHLSRVIGRSPLTLALAIKESMDIPGHIVEAARAAARIAQNPTTRDMVVSALADAHKFQADVVDELMKRFRLSDSDELKDVYFSLRREQFKRGLNKPFEGAFQ